MRTLITLIVAALLPFLPSCGTTPGKQDPSILLSAGVTYMTARAVQGHPEKAVKLREAADALDVVAGGVVNRETILHLLTDRLGKNDPATAALVTLVSGYFLPGDLAIPQAAAYSALAKRVADSIRAGLPLSPAGQPPA